MGIITHRPSDGIEALVCWSCDNEVLLKELSAADGFCPYCKQEIET